MLASPWKRRLVAAIGVAMLLALTGCAGRPRVFDVRDFGARGDGVTLNTVALNRTIDACASAGGGGAGGTVRIGPGRYLTGTVHLRSNVTLVLEEGAELLGGSDLDAYDFFTPPRDTPLVGDRLQWHRALVLADGVDNVAITGRGVINGSGITDPSGEEGIRGPHAVLLGNCSNVRISGITIRDAGNYNMLLEFCARVDVRDVTITGGLDGVHLSGWKDRPCRDVTIRDCRFYTGDDCIAGWYWQHVRIERCVLNTACNGIRLYGPARDVSVRGCEFFGPARYPWRASGPLRHTSMGAGICIQPSSPWAQTPGSVDDLRISDIDMHDVYTPLHLAAHAPSTIGDVTLERIRARGVYRAAISVESWTDQPIGRVCLRDWDVRFVGGRGPFWSEPAEAIYSLARAQAGAWTVQPPGENPRPLPAWGLYVRNVNRLDLDNVRLTVQEPDERPAVILDDVDAVHDAGLKLSGPSPARIEQRNVRHYLAGQKRSQGPN